ncbi:imv membrane protein [Pteropox virus]|uniref:Imv membrane protein n=1 Tax=Pteropox virus TaxID=1873698 RepID=A0A1B1MRF1_9POXV|nr:imv membrane protein [Pteropox virus]ANS71157.1 imv membrane protein [Pteropox virus]
MDPKTDKEIYEYCDANPTDIRCRCLNPDPSIVKIGKETRLPYYCWYEPCKRADALLPAFLKKNISRCNVSDCSVSLGHVSLQKGNMNVFNVCGSHTHTTVKFSAKYLNQDIVYPIFDPKQWLPFIIIAFSIVILISK